MYLALQSGTIDGQDNPLQATMNYGFGEVTKSITMTNHVIDINWLSISEEIWQSFDEETKAVFMDGFQIASVLQYVFVPLVLPIISALGVDLVHFGVVIVLNMMIGLSTPPFGMCLFISSSISGAKLSKVSKEILPMILVMLVVLFILTYVPALTTTLPRLCGF